MATSHKRVMEEIDEWLRTRRHRVALRERRTKKGRFSKRGRYTAARVMWMEQALCALQNASHSRAVDSLAYPSPHSSHRKMSWHPSSVRTMGERVIG